MAIAAAVCAVDPPGRVMTGVAALGLVLFAGFSWRARPKLAITPEGLVVRGWIRTQLLQKPDIKVIRITEFRRIGRKVRLLEIELINQSMLILSRWDLGTNPLDVLDALIAAGYTSTGKR